MREKYVAHFFALTKLNISYEPKSGGSSMQTSSPRFLRYGIMLLLSMLAITYLASQSQQSHRGRSSHKHPETAYAVLKAHLPSVIPNLRVAATSQAVQDISLRKDDVALLDESIEQESIKAEPVMDKVLVIPKSFG